MSRRGPRMFSTVSLADFTTSPRGPLLLILARERHWNAIPRRVLAPRRPTIAVRHRKKQATALAETFLRFDLASRRPLRYVDESFATLNM